TDVRQTPQFRLAAAKHLSRRDVAHRDRATPRAELAEIDVCTAGELAPPRIASRSKRTSSRPTALLSTPPRLRRPWGYVKRRLLTVRGSTASARAGASKRPARRLLQRRRAERRGPRATPTRPSHH